MKLTRDELESVFDELGRRALGEGRQLDIAVYGESALILASNFRLATADVDAVATFDQSDVDRIAGDIARERGWPADWLNDGVRTYLSPAVNGVATHHALFRSYPSEATPGLRVYVPTAEYMLAMKLSALRVGDADQTGKDREDLKSLLKLCNISTPEAALEFASAFYSEFERGARTYPRQLVKLRGFFDTGVEPAVTPEYQTGNPPTGTA